MVEYLPTEEIMNEAMELELRCIMMTIVLRIFMRNINENEALLEINEARVIKGALPSRKLKLVPAWCVLHQDELMQNWEPDQDGCTLNKIVPLM